MTSRRQLYAAGEPFGDSATCKKPGGRIYGGGGGGQTTTNSIDPRFSPLIDYATQAGARVNKAGFNPYEGQRFEGMNQTQNMGAGMIADRALNGDPTMNQAQSTLQDTLSSGPRSATGNAYGGVNPGANTGQIQVGSNAYAGANPYLESAIEKAQLGTAGNLAKINATSGSFGNSGIQEVGARQMGEIASNMRMQDYGMQQQLAESGLNRGMQAQQFNSGITDSNLNRDFQGQQINSAQGQEQAQRNDSLYQNYMGNKLNALQLAPQYGNQAYTDASQLMKVGGQMQDQAQQGRDFNYQQFQDQQNTPYKQMAAYGGLLSGQGVQKSTTSGGGK